MLSFIYKDIKKYLQGEGRGGEERRGGVCFFSLECVIKDTSDQGLGLIIEGSSTLTGWNLFMKHFITLWSLTKSICTSLFKGNVMKKSPDGTQILGIKLKL